MDKIQIWRLLLFCACISISMQRPTSSSTRNDLDLDLSSTWADILSSETSSGSRAPSALTFLNTNTINPNRGLDMDGSFWEKTKTELLGIRQHRKRGFSMLARWKPFNSLGMQRTSIRNINRHLFPLNEYDLVSAETRALSRPSGQPLRWG